MTHRAIAAFAFCLALPAAALAMSHGQMKMASASMMDADGNPIGNVTFEEGAKGVLIRADLSDLPPGEHAFHLHQTGSCEDGFKAAGDHYNPTEKQHGLLNPEGAHAGDLPNIVAAEDGTAQAHFITADVTLGEGDATLLDDDGSAVIVHENPDSYQAEAGAGGRIACGVIEAN